MTLDQLGVKYRTDKASAHHDYLNTYEQYLKKYKGREIVLVDAIGGYEFIDRGGESLRMWAEYFPQATIIGIDIYEKMLDIPPNVKLFKCNQASSNGMNKIFDMVGKPTVFIDDFSHFNKETIETFEIVFPLLNNGGIYIVEDIEGSWYPNHGFGGTSDYNDMNFPSTVNYFRKLTNGMNAKYIENFPMDDISTQILTIHFYRNFIVIIKK
jgi:hypothetical protein